MNTTAPASTHVEQSPRLLHSVSEAAERTGLSRSTLYGFLRTGELGSVTVGSRRLVPAVELERFVATLVESQRQ